MKKVAISFKDFSFQYFSQAEPTLHNINLDIYQGEKVLIVGPSGSGKSTLANCINGLIPNSYPGNILGSCHIMDKDLSKSSIFDISNNVGTILQDLDGQFIGLSVAEDIAFSLENDCIKQDEIFERVDAVSKMCNTLDLLTYSPQELSGGQKQRVSLAGVLISGANILLFDEPLASLDPKTGITTMNLIDELHDQTNSTVVIIEHRLEDVLWGNLDRIILMSEGNIIADMKPSDLLKSDLLTKYGIREPLYLQALKYANVELDAENKFDKINTLTLNEYQINQVNNWYQNINASEKDNNNEVILSLENISFGYDDIPNVSNINLEVYKNEMLCIVGENGAGKTTLAKLISGFEKYNSGTMMLNGKDMKDLTIRERASYIGYVMQNPNQMISQTMIYDEVGLCLQSTNLTEEEKHEKIEKAMKVCGIYEFRKWPISALSYGQKKRVTIASVLVNSPEILILDEPTAGQDFKHYQEFMDFLCDLNRQGVTIILITHNMHLMLEYTTRSLVMVKGKLIANTTPAKLLCTKELVDNSALKETSLFTLAKICSISDPINFVEQFIKYDGEVNKNG